MVFPTEIGNIFSALLYDALQMYYNSTWKEIAIH